MSNKYYYKNGMVYEFVCSSTFQVYKNSPVIICNTFKNLNTGICETIRCDEETGKTDHFFDFCMDTHIDYMLHAIGYNQTNYRGRVNQYHYERNNVKYYKFWRNYFDAGEHDDPVWQKLVEIGCAEKERCYHVTEDGFRLLSLVINTVMVDYDNPKTRYDGRVVK